MKRYLRNVIVLLSLRCFFSLYLIISVLYWKPKWAWVRVLLDPRVKPCNFSVLQGASQITFTLSLHSSDGAVTEWVGEREMLAYLSHVFGESTVMMLEAMSSQAMPVFILLFKYRDWDRNVGQLSEFLPSMPQALGVISPSHTNQLWWLTRVTSASER